MMTNPADNPHAAETKAVADPHGVLLYMTAPLALQRLKAVLDLHQVASSDPAPNMVLLQKHPDLLSVVLTQWREGLHDAEVAKVRGALLDHESSSPADVAEAMLNLEELDALLVQLQGRWLPKLLGTDSFFTMFQPLVTVSDRTVAAYECLMRAWDGGTPIGAGRLIDAARVMGMMHQLDKAAWRSAIKRGSSLAQQGHQLFVNFTPSSIVDLRFGLHEAISSCKENGVPFERLVFEVTEAEQIRDVDLLKKIIAEYRGEGAKVALDDLGSGYSSILHLADLLPDYVKLDQGLVRGAHGDYVRSVLLKGITDAAHELGILVVAEGVETEDDLKFCIAIDADLVQGYYLARPAEVPQAVSSEAMNTLADWVRDLRAPG